MTVEEEAWGVAAFVVPVTCSVTSTGMSSFDVTEEGKLAAPLYRGA